MTIPADTADLATDRAPAHYADSVAATEDNLSTAQRAAVRAVRAACARQVKAEKALREAQRARILAVQEHAPELESVGWRPVARIIGTVSESTLRNDASRKLEEV